MSNKTDKLEKYTIFNAMKYIVLAAFILTFVYIAIMDGFDSGEGFFLSFSLLYLLLQQAL